MEITKPLKTYFKSLVSFTEKELSLVDVYFEPNHLKRKAYLLQEGKVCSHISFITHGAIRHFHIKDGEEVTCDFSFENYFITDFYSFTQEKPSVLNFQALEDTEMLTIKRDDLMKLYKECEKYETVGRLMAEKIAHRATEIAMSLSSDKPETRYLNLIKKQPDLFQRVQQKYIANFLGVSPESLSRIRKRILIRKS
jgi:CRP-like cAMP-binding protein